MDRDKVKIIDINKEVSSTLEAANELLSIKSESPLSAKLRDQYLLNLKDIMERLMVNMESINHSKYGDSLDKVIESIISKPLDLSSSGIFEAPESGDIISSVSSQPAKVSDEIKSKSETVGTHDVNHYMKDKGIVEILSIFFDLDNKTSKSQAILNEVSDAVTKELEFLNKDGVYLHDVYGQKIVNARSSRVPGLLKKSEVEVLTLLRMVYEHYIGEILSKVIMEDVNQDFRFIEEYFKENEDSLLKATNIFKTVDDIVIEHIKHIIDTDYFFVRPDTYRGSAKILSIDNMAMDYDSAKRQEIEFRIKNLKDKVKYVKGYEGLEKSLFSIKDPEEIYRSVFYDKDSIFDNAMKNTVAYYKSIMPKKSSLAINDDDTLNFLADKFLEYVDRGIQRKYPEMSSVRLKDSSEISIYRDNVKKGIYDNLKNE